MKETLEAADKGVAGSGPPAFAGRSTRRIPRVTQEPGRCDAISTAVPAPAGGGRWGATTGHTGRGGDFAGHNNRARKLNERVALNILRNLVLAVASLLAASEGLSYAETGEFPQAFFVQGLDIRVSEVELRRNGSYPKKGVAIHITDGHRLVLDHTYRIPGQLSGAWVTDLDRDEDPEITLWVRAYGAQGLGEFSLFELQGEYLSQHPFPRLTQEQAAGYAGDDQLTVSSSHLVHRFKTYKVGDRECCPTGPMAELIYGYDGSRVFLERYRRLD